MGTLYDSYSYTLELFCCTKMLQSSIDSTFRALSNSECAP